MSGGIRRNACEDFLDTLDARTLVSSLSTKLVHDDDARGRAQGVLTLMRLYARFDFDIRLYLGEGR